MFIISQNSVEFSGDFVRTLTNKRGPPGQEGGGEPWLGWEGLGLKRRPGVGNLTLPRLPLQAAGLGCNSVP